jgi:hypothetical protein
MPPCIRVDSGLAGTEPREHPRQFFGAYVQVFADPAPEHGGRDVAIASLLLGIVQDLEHDTFATREAVANVRQEVALVDQDPSLSNRGSPSSVQDVKDPGSVAPRCATPPGTAIVSIT